MSVNFTSVVNDDFNSPSLGFQTFLPRVSPQASYTVVTATGSVASDAVVVICNGAASITLTLPTGYLGRNLIIVNRAAFTVVSASSNVIAVGDLGVGGTPSTGILPAVANTWAHLVFNGTAWVIVSKNNKL